MMLKLYGTTIQEIGADAPELIQQGVVILFAAGAPPELAEVSVLHSGAESIDDGPRAGDTLAVGARQFRITAVGDTAWSKVREMGHVVFSFNGADAAERPGEICVAPEDGTDLAALFVAGAEISIVRPA